MSDRCVDIKRFLRDAFAFLGLEILHGSHIVQTVGELYENDPYVRCHREDHFAYILSLLLFAGKIADVRDLCKAVNQEGDLVAEIRSDRFEIDKGILDHIMEQAGRNAYLV